MRKVSSFFLALLLCFNISLSSVHAVHASVIETNLSSSRTTTKSRSSHRVKSSSRQTYRSSRTKQSYNRQSTHSTTHKSNHKTTYRPSFGYYVSRTVHSIFSWYFWGPIIRIALIIVVAVVIIYFLRRLFIH